MKMSFTAHATANWEAPLYYDHYQSAPPPTPPQPPPLPHHQPLRESLDNQTRSWDDTLLRITQETAKQAGGVMHAQTHTSEKGCEAVWQRSAQQALLTPTTCHNILQFQTKCSLVCSTTFYAWQVAASISSEEWLAIYLDWRSRPYKYRWTRECSSCTSEPGESELMVSCQALTWVNVFLVLPNVWLQWKGPNRS